MRLSAIALSAALVFSMPLSALAAGTDSGTTDTSTTKTCPKGQVYSKDKKKCVAKTSLQLLERDLLDQAWALARNSEFEAARELFEYAQNRQNPEVLNGLGYTNRKLGLFEVGIGYYQQALSIYPDYLQVREYLGEGYVSMGKLDLAREQLAEIERRSGQANEYYKDLAEAIETAVKTTAAQ